MNRTGWRRQRGHAQIGMAPLPDPVRFGPVGWQPFGAQATPNMQVGAYAEAMPTQVAGYWPDVQRLCGVESINRSWTTFGRGDRPYWQMTPYPQNPKRLLTDGRRPGDQLGPAQVSAILGPQRQARAAQAKSVAAGLLGW